MKTKLTIDPAKVEIRVSRVGNTRILSRKEALKAVALRGRMKIWNKNPNRNATGVF